MSQKHRMFPQPRILQQISCLFISVEFFYKIFAIIQYTRLFQIIDVKYFQKKLTVD